MPILPRDDGSLTIGTVADPAAGADVVFQVPLHERWRLHSVAFTLTTNATAATRLPRVDFYAALLLYESYGTSLGIEANSTIKYFAAEGLNFPTAGFYPHSGFALPTRLILPPATIVTITAALLKPTDQFSNIFVTYESWINA
jgi:hypothetical protein